jgi:hypothetical protein
LDCKKQAGRSVEELKRCVLGRFRKGAYLGSAPFCWSNVSKIEFKQKELSMMHLKPVTAIAFFAVALLGCKPEGPPPDLIKTQREALNKAKGVGEQLQQQAEQQKKAAEEAEK